jgi:hypothetical protein
VCLTRGDAGHDCAPLDSGTVGGLDTTVDHIEGDPTVARTNPIGKIKDTAVDTLKGSVSVTQGAVGQVFGKALGTVETVTSLMHGRKGHGKDEGRAAGGDPADRTEAPVEQAGSRKVHGDVLAPVKTAPAKTAPAKKAPAKKAAAKKAPVTKAAAKKTAKKAPAPDVTAKKAPAAPAPVPDEVTPADVAKQVAKQAPAKKAAAKKTAKKAAPRSQTPAAGAPAAEVVYSTGPEANSPAPPASSASSPSDEPLIDPGTVKAVASETETLARAADPDKG